MASHTKHPKWQPKGEARAPGQQIPRDTRWWTLKDDAELVQTLKFLIKRTMEDQRSLEMQRQMCARLYGNQNPMGFYGVTYNRMSIVHPALNGRLTYNVIAIVVDTINSKISKNRVDPVFLTKGGDYRMKRRAKKLTQFGQGLLSECEVHDELAPQVLRDAMIFGSGLAHVYIDPVTQRLAVERVIPSEVHVDEVEGFYGNPRQLHRTKIVDRLILAEQFPDHEKEIMQAAEATYDEVGGVIQTMSDSVAVNESWHLRSGPDADDGAHIISIDNAVLLREPYDKDRFPFAVLRWKPRVFGWWGEGLAEQLIGTQMEVNHLLYIFQRAIKMMGAFKIAYEVGSKIPPAALNDKIGALIPFRTTPPVYMTPPAVQEQYFTWFERLKAQAFEIARLSMLSATGIKPAGLNSGEAQRVYHDIEGEGFQVVGRAFEAFHLDIIEIALDLVRDIMLDDKDASYEVKAAVASDALPGRKFLKTIDWRDVSMEQDEYVLEAWPVSTLPNEPSGRLQTVTELGQAGLIDQQTMIKLMNFPDLAQVENMLSAMEDWVMSILDRIVESGKFEGPDPLMDLQMARRLAQQEYALGSANGLEEKKREQLRTFIAAVDRLSDKAEQAMIQKMQQGQQQAQALQAGAAAPAGGLSPAELTAAPQAAPLQ